MGKDVVNVSNLKIGKVKNYKEMCRLLGEEIREGNSKNSQLKKWERYFYFTREKQAFVIEEIYKIPLTIEEYGSRAIYAQNITNMLLLMLQKKGGDIIITRKQLMLELGMINHRYVHKNTTSVKYDIKWESTASERYNLSQFFNNSYTKLNGILRSSFESLENKSLIKVQPECYMIKYRGCGDYHLANEREEDVISSTINHGLVKFGIEGKREAFFDKNYENYMSFVNEELLNKFYIEGVYKVVRIHPFNIENINIAINVKEQKQELNTKVLSKIKEMNQKIYDKQYALKYEGNWGEQEIFMYDVNFVSAQDALSDYFIDINS